MDATTSALINKIIQNLEPLKSLNNPFYKDLNFLGAFLTSIVAFSIALFNEPLRRMWRRINLVVSKNIVVNKQNKEDSIYYRLLFPMKEIM